MTQEHPIRPPHELVQQWVSLACENEGYETWQDLATQAARWGADQQLQLDAEQVNRAWQRGADQELEACVEWFKNRGYHSDVYQDLLTARRPKPPSLKEQSIALIDKIQGNKEMWDIRDLDIIRQALESLPS